MTDNRTTERVDHPPRVREAIDELMREKDATDNRTTELLPSAHGTLTAEQVREAVMSADRWEKPMGNTGLTNTHLIIRDDGWQAIADELNATLGSVTCHMSFIDEYETASGEEEYLCECSECGSQTWEPAHDLPLYCRKCGKVVS